MTTSAGELIYTVDLDTGRLVSGSRRASRAFDEIEHSAANLNPVLSKTYGLMVSISGALAVDRIIKYADAWTVVGNKVTNYLKDGQNLVDVQNAIFKVAQDSSTPLQAVATLYGRLEPATKGLINSGDELIKITETINKAFVVSGATSEEASNAIVQLSQALGAGALRSEEFNSVNEQGPRIMQGIADYMGVARGELKSLAAQGKITTEVVINSLRQMSSSVDTEFSKMNDTFEMKGTQALNNLTKSLGTNADVQKAVAKIGDAMVALSENIGTAVVAGELLATVYGAKLVGAMANSAAAMIKNAVANHAASIASVEAAEKALSQATAEKVRAEAERFSAVTTVGLTEAKLASVKASSAQITSEISVAKANENSIRVQLSQIASEKALEAQRLKSQISDIGRIKTSTRMAEIRLAEIALNKKLATAQAETSAAIAAATAREVAVTNELSAAKSTLRLATLSVTQATAAQTAAQTALTATSRAASVAVGVMNGALALVGGPAGIAFIAAAGIYYLASSMESARKESIEYGNALEVTAGSLRNLTSAQVAAQEAKLERSVLEQTRAITKQRKAVSDLSATYEHHAKNLKALIGSTDGLIQLQQELSIATADLETKEAELSRTSNKLYTMQQYQNGALRENYVAIGSSNSATGIQLAMQRELNSVLAIGNRELKNRKEYVSVTKVTTEGQGAIEELKKQAGLSRLAGEARARLAGEQRAGAGATLTEKRVAGDLAVEIYRNEQANQELKSSEKDLTEERKRSEASAKQNAQTISDAKLKTQQLTTELANLKNGTDEVTGSTSRYSIESARMEAQQQLNKEATEGQVEALAKQILAQKQITAQIAQQGRLEAQKKEAQGFVKQQAFDAASPLEQIDIEEQAKLAKLEEYRQLQREAEEAGRQADIISLQEYEATKNNIIKQAADERAAIELARNSMILSASSDFFGGMADLTGAFAGEQSGAYKALFAISKGFAIANAALQLQTAIANASALPWPANFPAIAQAVALGGQIASGIAGVNYGGAREFGGPVDAGKMYRVGEGGKPEVFQSGGKNFMIPGDGGKVIPNDQIGGGGFSQNVQVHNYSGENVQTKTSMDGKQLDVIIGEVAKQISQRRGGVGRALASSTATKWKAQ